VNIFFYFPVEVTRFSYSCHSVLEKDKHEAHITLIKTEILFFVTTSFCSPMSLSFFILLSMFTSKTLYCVGYCDFIVELSHQWIDQA
jgi:hypothetical protein